MSIIYKITNSKNEKIYIGYTSQNLNARWRQHKYEALTVPEEENHSYLYNAMRYYGIENFKIEPIYTFDEAKEDWRELEKFFIKKFNSLSPNGYNLLEGGDMPPIHFGNENPKTRLSDEDLPLLIQDLKNSNLLIKDIAKKYNISRDQVSRINQGKNRKIEGLDYPIRKFTQQEEYVLEIMEILSIDKTLSNAKIAELFPCYFRANEIASINTGKKYAYLWKGDFPIRKILVPNDYDKKQSISKEIAEYIIKNKNLKKITQKGLQEQFKQGRRVIEKVVAGIYPYQLDNYEYPLI